MDVMVPIFIIGLAVAMAIGPVMMLQPNQAQRRAAKLRSNAAQRGLIVRAPGEGLGMNYMLPWRSSKELDNNWHLEKQSFAHGAHFYNEWDFKRDLKGGSNALLKAGSNRLKDYLDQLDGVSALGVNRVGVYLCWDERLNGKSEEECLAVVESNLKTLQTIVSAAN